MREPGSVKRFVAMSAALHGAALVLALSLVSAPGPAAGVAALISADVSRESSVNAGAPLSAALPAPPVPPVRRSPLAPPSFIFREEAPQTEPVAEVQAEPERFEPFVPSAPPESPSRFDLPFRRESDSPAPTPAQGPAHSTGSPTPSVRGAGDTPRGEYLPPALLAWDVPRSVRRGFKGRVVALIEVDAWGKATTVRLEVGTGNQTFDARLKEALQKARYEPARLQGMPVARSLLQPIDFN